MTVRILQGDCRERLKELPDGSVHCVVTSPPYFGLRDYGTGQWEGGAGDCKHAPAQDWVGDGGDLRRSSAALVANEAKARRRQGATCRCGATRVDRQIGLEEAPDDFIAALVDLFRDVRRVLRDDGTLWLNLGDSYANDGKWGGHTGGKHAKALHDSPIGRNKRYTGLKPKDLIGIPWRVALALQADGWFLRQDIVWSKPNPMPESVEDRCTNAHEYLFLLSKSPRYYFDANAIAEPADRAFAGSEFHVGTKPRRGSGNLARKPRPAAPDSHNGAQGGSVPWEGTTRNKRSVWTVSTVPFDLERCTACCTTYEAASYRALRREKIMAGDAVVETRVICGCGRFDAWLSHFATFPPDLIDDCIKAGCPVGGTVLDPFFGAGTTGLVADRLHRNAVGCELNPHYVAMAQFRLKGDGGLFTEVEAA